MSIDTLERTSVIYRKWNSGKITAILPEYPANERATLCIAYEDATNELAIDYDEIVQKTVLAEEHEYKKLHRTLQQHYGLALTPIRYATTKEHKQRALNASSWY